MFEEVKIQQMEVEVDDPVLSNITTYFQQLSYEIQNNNKEGQDECLMKLRTNLHQISCQHDSYKVAEKLQSEVLDVFAKFVRSLIQVNTSVRLDAPRLIIKFMNYIQFLLQDNQHQRSKLALQAHMKSQGYLSEIKIDSLTCLMIKIIQSEYLEHDCLNWFSNHFQLSVRNERQDNLVPEALPLSLFEQNIRFFHAIQYPTLSQIIKKDNKIALIAPNEKSRDYENEFESPYIASMVSFYESMINVNYMTLTYPEFLEWLNKAIKFELKVSQATLFKSSKMVQDELSKILNNHLTYLLQNPQGPLFMFKSKNLEQIEKLINIISIDVENIHKIGKVFETFILEKAKEDKLFEADCSMALVEALLQETDRICHHFTAEGFQHREICRVAFLSGKNSAFSEILNSNISIFKSVLSIIDDLVRQGSDEAERSEKLNKLEYYLSVYDNHADFFKQYGQMMSYRLLDDYTKYAKIELEIIERLKASILSPELNQIEKILDDVRTSSHISNRLAQDEEFQQIQPTINNFNLLIIGDHLVNSKINPNCAWWLPFRALEEMANRQTDFPRPELKPLKEMEEEIKEAPQKPKKKPLKKDISAQQVLKRGQRSRGSMEAEKLQVEKPYDTEEKQSVNCVVGHPLVDKLLTLADFHYGQEFQSEKWISSTASRMIRYPLLSVGMAIVDFKCRSGKYTLQLSTPQMILALMLQDSPDLTVEYEAWRNVIKVDHLDEDLQALCGVGIVSQDGETIALNPKFKSEQRKIKLRPKSKVNQKDQAQLLHQIKQGQEKLLQSYIVKVIKEKKRMLISQLIEDVRRMAEARFVTPQDTINLVLQNLIAQDQYIQLDQDKVLYALYKP